MAVSEAFCGIVPGAHAVVRLRFPDAPPEAEGGGRLCLCGAPAQFVDATQTLERPTVEKLECGRRAHHRAERHVVRLKAASLERLSQRLFGKTMHVSHGFVEAIVAKALFGMFAEAGKRRMTGLQRREVHGNLARKPLFQTGERVPSSFLSSVELWVELSVADVRFDLRRLFRTIVRPPPETPDPSRFIDGIRLTEKPQRGCGRGTFAVWHHRIRGRGGRRASPPCDSKAENGDICVSFDIGSAALAVSPKTSRLDAAESRMAPT